MEKAFFSRIHSFQHISYADIKGMRENGYEPEQPGVLAHPGLRIGNGHRRLMSRLMPLPHLQVGVEGGTGQREVGKT